MRCAVNDLWTEAGYVSLNKRGETLCGDRVEIAGGGERDVTMVLADGLGSGVKANILATLTSKIVCTLADGGMPIEEWVSTVASTLPVCSVRQVAYSTFTLVRIVDNRMAHIVQFDNPATIVLREGEPLAYPTTTRTVAGKTIWESAFPVQCGDVFICLSDGAEYAGTGRTLNFGWSREAIAQFASANYLPQNAAKSTAGLIADECNRLYGGEPGDDTTVAVLRVRRRHSVNLVVGPPADPAQDMTMMNLFFSKDGAKVVCGGTTGRLAADYLGKPLVPTLDYPDPEVPPVSTIEGVDLVTEGVVTLSKVLGYARDYLDSARLAQSWATGGDGASQIARELFENATDIHFFVGRAINPAHQNPDLPITFGVKQQLIQSLADCLERMGKHIRLSYF